MGPWQNTPNHLFPCLSQTPPLHFQAALLILTRKKEEHAEIIANWLIPQDFEVCITSCEICLKELNLNMDAHLYSLPDYILALIFVETCQLQVNEGPPFETVASLVRRWRSVTVNLVFLWSTIYFRLFSSIDMPEAHPTRSKGYFEQVLRPPLTSNHIHCLLTSCPSLTILCLVSLIVDKRQNIASVGLPHLTSIDIDFGFGWCIDEIYIWNVFSAILPPALTSLTLRGVSACVIDAFIDILQISPYLPKHPALTHIVLYTVESNARCGALIAALPSITHFSLIGCDNPFSIFKALAGCGSYTKGIPWPRLQTITVNLYKYE